MFRALVPQLVLLAALPAPGAPLADVCSLPGRAVPLPALHEATARPLPFFYDLYTFRHPAGGTTVVAAFAVSVGELEQRQVENEVRYRFDVTLVLADTALRSVSRTDDSVYVGFPRALPSEHLLFTHIEVRAPPSRNTLQRVIMTDPTAPGIGQLYQTPFPVPDYSGRRLMLSDIALGQPGAEVGWKRGDVTLALLPTRQFPASAFEVFYEIYNLPQGNTYVTEIAVEPVDGGPADGRAVNLRFTGEAAARPDGSVQEIRRVETSLPRGSYRITVTIRDEDSGQTATRSRSFQVHESGRGATLVAAIPRGSRPFPK